MKIECLQDEGVDYSSHHMRAFVRILKVHTWTNFAKAPIAKMLFKFPMEFARGTWKTFRKLSKSHTNALIQPVKSHFISRSVVKKGMELMANTVGFAFGKEEVVASSPPQVLLMKDLIWKFSSKISEWMKVKISSNVKFFKLYLREREANIWNNIRTFRSLKS